MSDINNFFQSFYDHFVLRDFFGKVIPGLIVLFSFFFPYTSQFPIFNVEYFFSQLSISFWLWFAIIGVSWILGITVQIFGNKTGITLDNLKTLREKHWWEINGNDRNELNNKKNRKESKKVMLENWAEIINDFSIVTKPEQLKQRERFVFIKEATGNGCIALSIFIIKISIDVIIYLKTNKTIDIKLILPYLPAILIFIVIIIFMWITHRIHVEKQFHFELEVLYKRDRLKKLYEIKDEKFRKSIDERNLLSEGESK